MTAAILVLCSTLRATKIFVIFGWELQSLA